MDQSPTNEADQPADDYPEENGVREDTTASSETATEASEAGDPTPVLDTPLADEKEHVKEKVEETVMNGETEASEPDEQAHISSTASATESSASTSQNTRPASPATSVASSSHKSSTTRTTNKSHPVSMVLISSALETILSSKETKRYQQLRESTQHAIDLIKSNQASDRPREIFEPLRLACETRSERLMVASLDCISKLISYSFFAEPDSYAAEYVSPPPSPNPGRGDSTNGSEPKPSLVDLVAHTITACHTDTTPDPVSLQIVKALLSLVLSVNTLVHHSSLLKAIRTVYNVFLLSADPVNQMVAQGGLTQMVHHIFTRCQTGTVKQTSSHLHTPPAGQTSFPIPAPAPQSSEDAVDPKKVLQTTDSVTSLPLESGTVAPSSDDSPPQANGSHVEAPPLHSPGPDDTTNGIHLDVDHSMSTHDLFVKDAFLVFRALCKLTMKPLNTDSEKDLKSHAMRSKLLSLHLLLAILNSHMPMLVDTNTIIYSNSSNEATTFVQAINQYLCLTLSRNAVSPVPQVFEISVELFWRVLSGMRTKLKKEIGVLLHEIFIPILEMRTSTLKQKAVILGMLSRLCQDPQALVEIYLNYDCDREAIDNIFEHLMNIISKIGAPGQKFNDPASPVASPTQHPNKPASSGAPSLSTNALSVPGSMDTSSLGHSEKQLRRQSLECMVTVLRSLVAWGITSAKAADDATVPPTPGKELSEDQSRRESTVTLESSLSTDRLGSASGSNPDLLRQSTPDISDDPTKFESAKQRKTALLEGIRKFNFKPKRGIQALIEGGFITSNAPPDIATFLLNTDGLNKSMIGEYIGEGEEHNIAVMHAFVDQLDFRNSEFIDALRTFLQAFRLPGEAQKIDRIVLKFSDRYIAGNSQTPFANADAAYILAYSVILLNTDQHSPQIKKRMTKPEFIKNNRGINDGADLPEDFLNAVYDDIAGNEIRMKDEVDAGLHIQAPGPGLAGALANVGRDLQKEQYILMSSGMANKTEGLFRTMMKSQRKGSKGAEQFFSASHFVHVRPMFEVSWIPFLAGLSAPLQETEDLEVVELCLDGFKSAIKIVCFFDLELERNAFVTTLAKFTFLNNLGEMKAKNMEAIKTLLDVAVTEGNNLRGSWHEVLTCVSQLEHMQLIGSGVEVADKKAKTRKGPTEELANESRSTHITVAADMVFSLSHFLSGTAIVDFVRALSDVSWEEIQSSGLSQQPRLFSLQKLVEISYYNMNRIRIEWSNLWEILGEHFNQVCCHSNPHVGFFALDSLRQLAMRFLEKEELAHFKFQKDFLKPFEHTMAHNNNPDIRDMVLQCLQQMIQARVQNLRSGWHTMFGVFSAASKVLTEKVVTSAFEIVTRLNRDHFAAIVNNGSFADLTVCITEYCKVSKYQKISLLAIAMLRNTIPTMLKSQDVSLKSDGSTVGGTEDEPTMKYWFPVLFGFYDIIMNGEDLEIRRLALDSMFNALKQYGRSFPVEFWDTVCKRLLFPIFAVLKSSQDVSRFTTQEDMSVWLSTTMIQALRDLIDLYTFYFDILEGSLDGLLDLLCVCICQENDTLARIGTSCLQQLLENNVTKLSPARWERVTTTFMKLFKTTTPHQLFDDDLRVEIDGSVPDVPEPASSGETNGETILPAPLSPHGEHQQEPSPKTSLTDRRRIFKQIIVKCVLQLLLIETTNELLRNDAVYNTIPPEHLLRLMAVLDQSYRFARMFNEDKDLRTGLWKVGFMKHLPNLLKQESSSASTIVHVLLRMYFDPRAEHQTARPQIAERFIPLSLDIIKDFVKLRADSQTKNIQAWAPVVAEIVDGFVRLDTRDFKKFLPVIYPLVTELLEREQTPEIRAGLKGWFARVGVVSLGISS